MEQRISLVTLGVTDLSRSRAFYERLGWHGQEVAETVFFQAGGQAVVLWGRDKLAADSGIADEGACGFGGIALAHNVRSREEVDEVVGDAAAAGAAVTKEPRETFYGGYAGSFADLDGHVWEIAHNPGFTLGADGALTLPDFGSGTTTGGGPPPLPLSGDGILAHSDVQVRLPAQDLERARRFYAEKLGLRPVEERDGGLRYRCGSTLFALFASTGEPSGTHTQMGWKVDDIEATVAELRGRGLEFEEYDFPGFATRDGIVDIPGTYPSDGGVGERAVWFRDSENNLIGIGQAVH